MESSRDSQPASFPRLHLITGFALDRRILESLHLPPDRFVCHGLIAPQPGESLPDYALRLADAIGYRAGDSIGGLSLGGMFALEIARQRGSRKLFLLASCTHPRFIRLPFRMAARISRWIPDLASHAILKQVPRVLKWLGLQTPAGEIMLRDIILAFPRPWIRIFVRMIFDWKGCPPTAPYRALHSRGDWLIRPQEDLDSLTLLPGSSHLITLTRHDACRAFLLEDPDLRASDSGESQRSLGSGGQ